MLKFAIISLCAISLAGCASERVLIQQKFSPRPHVEKPLVMPPPVVEVKPAPVMTTKLTKPRWYDSFRKHIHLKKKAK